MMKRALMVSGGWPGHHPERITEIFRARLAQEGYAVTVSEDLDVYADADGLRQYQLIFPCWTMGKLSPEQTKGLVGAVRDGVGLGGVHGGMGDAFRGNLNYEWMVGGNFLGHPHVGDYTVRLTAVTHPITEGMPTEFPYHSEQYYMMIDPMVTVLADTLYVHDGQRCVMPVVWIRQWGKGRVFYSALGHDPAEFENHPHVTDLVVRGLLWASA